MRINPRRTGVGDGRGRDHGQRTERLARGCGDAHDGTGLVARSRDSPDARRAAPKASAVPARSWSPDLPSRPPAPPNGWPSTPASSPSQRSTARSSSPPRGWAGRAPASGATRDGRARRFAVRLLHTRLHLQHGRRVLPGRSAAAGARQRRARPERFRSARVERQPVPMHRLPADPRRRVRLGNAARRRPVRGASQPTGTRPVGHGTAAGRPGLRSARPLSSTRCSCCGSAPTPRSSRAAPTGASR